MNPGPLHWDCGILATGPRGKPPEWPLSLQAGRFCPPVIIFVCVCVCVPLCRCLSLFTHPLIPLSVSFASIPLLPTLEMQRIPTTQTLLVLGSAATSRACALDPSKTGLPPQAVLGGANGKGPGVSEVTHPCLSSPSGSGVSGLQECRPLSPGGFRMDLCHPGKHLG